MSKVRTQFLLRFWGADMGKAIELAKALPFLQQPERDDGEGAYCIWFPDDAAREAFVARLKRFCLVIQLETGEDALTRCVARVKVDAGGQFYELNYDFGFGYSDEAARFMFTDGNYSCDCNLSVFIQDIDPSFPEMDCGDSLKVLNIDVTRAA